MIGPGYRAGLGTTVGEGRHGQRAGRRGRRWPRWPQVRRPQRRRQGESLEAYVTYDLIAGDGSTRKKPEAPPPNKWEDLSGSRMGCLGWVLLAIFDVVVIFGFLAYYISPK